MNHKGTKTQRNKENYPFPNPQSPLPITHYPIPITQSPLPITHYPLPNTYQLRVGHLDYIYNKVEPDRGQFHNGENQERHYPSIEKLCPIYQK